MVGLGVASLINILFGVVEALVIARAVLSWVPTNRYHPAVRFINEVTDPLLRPFRSIVPVARGGIDFSPFILLIILGILHQIIMGMLRG